MYREQVTRIVEDPQTAEGLMPRGYPIGCKRPVIDTGYYQTFNRDNVTLVDLRRGGVALSNRWADGPRTYLGLQVHGFPNLFCVTGPGSPSVLSNMMVSIEQHVDWIADCIAHMNESQFLEIEATLEAEASWVDHVNEVASGTMLTAPSCNSWYLGVNIVGKPRIFMPYVGGVGKYRKRCGAVAANGYEGFALSA